MKPDLLASIMNWSKNLYVFMLSALIVFSGCFGTGTTDGDDGEDLSGTTIINNYYNNTTNQPPVIHVANMGPNSQNDGDEQRSTYNQTTGEEETRMYYRTYGFWLSVIDVDGNITAVGIDGDLDLVIEHPFTHNSSWNDFSYHESYGFAWSNTSDAGRAMWGGEYTGYCYLRFNLIAIDDDGAQSVIPYTTIIGNNQGCDVWDD